MMFSNCSFNNCTIIVYGTAEVSHCVFSCCETGMKIYPDKPKENTMYAFQEVHTYNSQPCGSSSSRVDIIHEETGLRTRYYGKTPPPWPHEYHVLFHEFFSLEAEDRIKMLVNGKKLPAMKVNYPSMFDVKLCNTTPTPIPPPVAVPFPQGVHYINTMPITFGDCKPASTPGIHSGLAWKEYKEQGNNPMRSYNDTANVAGATATIINAQSDESKQRDYLMNEYNEITNWRDQTPARMRKLFNWDAPKVPKSSADMIAAFKNGKFTVDQTKVDANAKFYASMNEDGDSDFASYDDEDNYVGSQYYGITFTDLPVYDSKGYQAAMAEYETLKKNVKRTIIVGTPAEGLAALISLETFAPTPVTIH